MARPRNPVPTYRLHKQSGQAVVTVRGADDRPRDILLGKFGTAESRAEYARIIAELKAAPAAAVAGGPPADSTVVEVLAAFWDHATAHYRRPDGTPTNEVEEYRQTLRVVRGLYGHNPAREFGPLALKAVRQKMIDAGLSRGLINRRVGRVKRVFKWAASEELVPATVFVALQTVAGLQKGRTTAREPEPVKPVPDADVEATLPHLSTVVAAMVRFQRLTGCRPQDVCQLRGDAIDRSAEVWVYRPCQHKGAWRGKAREVLVGPKAQAVVAPFLFRSAGGYVFSPAEAKAEHLAARRAGRKSKVWPSHALAQEAKRKRKPRRAPGEKYTTRTYGGAIARAARRAGVTEWAPNQLRHAAGSEVRRAFGLEAAQAVLGHERADVTQVYAEKNKQLAATVAAKIG